MLSYDKKGILILNKIDGEFKAYLLGFLYADGCILKTKTGYQLEINLAEKDKEHLQKLNYIISLGKRKIYKKLYNKKYLGARLIIANQRFCNELLSLGMVLKKSLILEPPKNLPNKWIKHFIRGYFDGDGCITFNKNHRNIYTVAKLCGTKNLLSFINDWFKEQGNLGSKAKPISEGNIWRLIYSGKIGEHFINLLYTDALIFLDRKFILAEAYI